MSVSDPVADFLTCVHNAVRARHKKVDVPASRLKEEFAKLLRTEVLKYAEIVRISGAKPE